MGPRLTVSSISLLCYCQGKCPEVLGAIRAGHQRSLPRVILTVLTVCVIDEEMDGQSFQFLPEVSPIPDFKECKSLSHVWFPGFP